MAKSLRSKSKLQAKSLRRHREHNKLAEQRAQRLAEKQAANDAAETTEKPSLLSVSTALRSKSKKSKKKKKDSFF